VEGRTAGAEGHVEGCGAAIREQHAVDRAGQDHAGPTGGAELELALHAEPGTSRFVPGAKRPGERGTGDVGGGGAERRIDPQPIDQVDFTDRPSGVEQGLRQLHLGAGSGFLEHHHRADQRFPYAGTPRRGHSSGRTELAIGTVDERNGSDVWAQRIGGLGTRGTDEEAEQGRQYDDCCE